MKVVLLQYVEKLGQAGDVCNVSDGHARNFLFPQKLAVPATREALAKAEQLRKEREHEAELDLSRAHDLARRLDDFELELTQKASESGTLFAAVTKKMIAEELTKRGFRVHEKHVLLNTPIKEVGESEVTLSLPHGLEVRIRVIVNGT